MFCQHELNRNPSYSIKLTNFWYNGLSWDERVQLGFALPLLEHSLLTGLWSHAVLRVLRSANPNVSRDQDYESSKRIKRVTVDFRIRGRYVLPDDGAPPGGRASFLP
jgi:hypothetical protein